MYSLPGKDQAPQRTIQAHKPTSPSKPMQALPEEEPGPRRAMERAMSASVLPDHFPLAPTTEEPSVEPVKHTPTPTPAPFISTHRKPTTVTGATAKSMLTNLNVELARKRKLQNARLPMKSLRHIVTFQYKKRFDPALLPADMRRVYHILVERDGEEYALRY
jgi:hypothetical protein